MLEQAHARGLLNGTPTIIVTADPAAPGIGAQPVVGKPVDFAALVPQLRRLIAGGASDAGDDKVGVTGEQWPGASRPHASARIELVLYVTEDSLPCHRAQAVMQQLLSDYEPGQVAFAVRNVGEHLDAAERDHILFTPTLVKRLPAPRVWVLGDLSKRRVVTDLLAMAGVAPKTSL